MSDDRVLIKSVEPAGRALRFELVGEDQLSGGIGIWEDLPRPLRRSATEWVGTTAYTYTLPLMLDGVESTVGRDTVIEPQINVVASWALPTRKTGRPPVLRLAGPLKPAPSVRWVVTGLEWGPVIRNPAGRRVQASFNLTLGEFIEAVVVKSPARKSRNRSKGGR